MIMMRMNNNYNTEKETKNIMKKKPKFVQRLMGPDGWMVFNGTFSTERLYHAIQNFRYEVKYVVYGIS